ncbi:MAG: phosphoribosylformylglycinamidine synthase subunit PurQ [Chlorobi bacterium]|nr:phosphoribosylformylglycinamidine synthase subunit PurQ [Chlorobiota bacterium]MCI0716813.1 phosphoribosylformylglycinamidine synthase subunit PurQ [Chlorobiota bacterium]
MSKVKFGIIVFPGSNCDHDAYNVLKNVLKQDTKFLWHKDSTIGDRDVIIVPGGFSYGDYLRCGAIARFSNIMKDVVRFASDGGIVIGICNGFQIVCEAGLLPGALIRNANLKFVCRNVTLNIENKKTIFTSSFNGGVNKDKITIPIAHADGNYICSIEIYKNLFENNQILFRYEDNPNGSFESIAGIINKKGNVMGMMPHPERASEDLVGGHDGRHIFESVINSMN